MSIDAINGGGNLDEFKAAQQARVAQATTQATEAKQQGGAPDGASESIGQAQGPQSAEYPKL